MTNDSDTTGDTDNSNTLYLVDGSSYMYRAFYAIRNLTNSSGMPTNAVYGFTQMLQSLLQDHNPEYVAVALDAYGSDVPNFREEIYEEYKANRDKMPEELAEQVPYIRKVIEALHIPKLEKPGVEADDLIATAAREAERRGLEVCIISGDKDLMQLLGPNIRMHDTKSDKTYTPESVQEKYGVTPEKQKYVMAMAGDTSDNIPGVPGIGPKTGGKLVRKFDDLNGVYENLDKVGGKKRPKTLAEHEDQARVSLELVTLRENCDIKFDLDRLRLSAPNLEELEELFSELEFSRPLEDIKDWIQERGWHEEGQLELSLGPSTWENTGTETPDKDYRGIFSLEELDEVLEACREAGCFAFDLETTSLDSLRAEIVGMSFAWEDHAAVYVPVAHTGPRADEQLDRVTVFERVAPLLESEEIGKILQHWKYEWIVLDGAGIELRGVQYDTMLMSYVLDPVRTSHSLDALVREFLDYDTIKYSDVAGSGKSQVSFQEVVLEDAIPYACEDADLTRLLSGVLEAEMEEADGELDTLLHDVEIPLSRVLGVMERTGICVDRDVLGELSDEFQVELEQLEAEINDHAGGEINPNSPKQLREVLFEDLGLPVKKRTKTGPSTARSVLEQLSDEHPLPDLILEYRSFSKLKGTYVDALPELIREDGRIHTSFNQAVTATGRLSSSDPNLQNIPIRTRRGRRIRRAFVPDEHRTLIVADYSQIELRILAHMSQDPLLLEAYRNGRDIHTLTAAKVFDVDADEVSKKQRELGKTINYGVLYGMGSRRLARDFDISQSDASRYIENYFERYEVVDDFFDELVHKAHEQGYVETMFGRRRRLPGLDGHGGQQAYAERAAVNTPIQGTAADIIKIAMVNLQERIEGEELPLSMLLQVHDELVFEADDGFLDEAVDVVRQEMEGVADLDVPLTVDVGSGPNWLEAK